MNILSQSNFPSEHPIHPHDGGASISRFERMLGSNDLTELTMVKTEMVEELKFNGELSLSSAAKLAGYTDTSVLPHFLPESLPNSVIVHILNHHTFTLFFLNESDKKLEVGTVYTDLFETTADILKKERERIHEKINNGIIRNGQKYEYILDEFGNLAYDGCCTKKDNVIVFNLKFPDKELRILEGEKGSEFGIPYYKMSVPDTSISFFDYAGMIRALDMRHEAVREELRREGSLLVTHRTTGAFLTVYSADNELKQSEWTLKRYFGYFGAVQTLAWCWLVEFYQRYDLQSRKLICPDPGWKSILIKNSIEEAYELLHFARPRVSANWSVHPESCIPFLANVAFKHTVSVLYKANLSLPIGEMERDIYFINYYTEVGMPSPKFLCKSDPQNVYPKQWVECIASSILAAIHKLGTVSRQKDEERDILEEIILIDKEKIAKWFKDGKNAKLYVENSSIANYVKEPKTSKSKGKHRDPSIKLSDSKRKRKKIKQLTKFRKLRHPI